MNASVFMNMVLPGIQEQNVHTHTRTHTVHNDLAFFCKIHLFLKSIKVKL